LVARADAPPTNVLITRLRRQSSSVGAPECRPGRGAAQRPLRRRIRAGEGQGARRARRHPGRGRRGDRATGLRVGDLGREL